MLSLLILVSCHDVKKQKQLKVIDELILNLFDYVSCQKILNKKDLDDLGMFSSRKKDQLIKDYLETHMGMPIYSTAEKQINPDAKEAILFAVLANETLAGNADFYKHLGAKFPAVSMGKISLPG